MADSNWLCVSDSGLEHLQDAPPGLRIHAPLLAGLLRMRLVDDAQRDAEGGRDVMVQLVDAERVAALAGPAARAETLEAVPA